MSRSITGRIAWPISGSRMRRLDQGEIYKLGQVARLRVLIEGDDLQKRCMPHIIRANFELDDFQRANSELLPQSAERAGHVMAALAEIVRLNLASFDHFARKRIGDELDRFETTLQDELRRLPTFLSEPVGAYSFGALIGEAFKVFPKPLRDKLPEKVLSDFKAAGACLAFDQGTACGFHVYRATDAMLRVYCAHFNATPQGTGRDWGRYIQALRDLKKLSPVPAKMPNERTVELLDRIRALDRNPLIHPEDDLDPNEALAAFDMCKVAVTFMAQEVV